MEQVTLGVMPLMEAKDLKSICEQSNLELILNHNGETCTRGCTVTVEVICLKKDLEGVVSIIRNRNQKSYEGLDINPELLESVFDPSSEEVTCPACAHTFKPTGPECPDCGLCF